MNLDSIRLAVGIPCSFPTVPFSFFRSFVMMEKPDYVLITKTNGPVDVLRNDIVEKALAEDATHLIFMDVDQIYPVNTINRLLSHNLPIVGASISRRYPPFDKIILRVNKDQNGYDSVEDWEEGSLLECDATGTGCILYDMDVFRKLDQPWFQFIKDEETGMTIGEDIYLCQRLKDIGYKIFVDTTVEVGHLAQMVINRKTNLLYRSMKEKHHRLNLEQALQNDNNGAA